MNLRETIIPLVRYWWLILLSVVIVLGGIVIANKISKVSYDGSTTLILKQMVAGPEEGQDYKYDGFYTIQANQMFSDSVETWLEAPDFVKLIFDRANLSAPEGMNALKGVFDFDKVISQSVAVRLNRGSADEVKQILEAMIQVMKEKTESLLVDKNSKPLFTIDTTPVLVLQHEIDYRLQFGAGLVGALGLGAFLAYVFYAFEDKKKEKK